MDSPNYDAACRAIDRANADDPRRVEGEPHEVVYSRRMVEWVGRLAPGASEELRLAARGQHLRRWTIPRNRYPDGRAGYLQWRETLKKFHADAVAELMKEAGYGEAGISKVRSLLIRKNFAEDPEGQTLEDAACLVFLEFEFSAFAAKTDDEKTVSIVRKTWGKMSPAAREAARELKLGAREKGLLDRALA